MNKLKGESGKKLLDYAREFQRERITYILTVEAKLRMWKKFADDYSHQTPEDPRIRELLALYVGYSRIHHDVLRIYDHDAILLQEVLGEDDFKGISRDVAEDIMREAGKKV